MPQTPDRLAMMLSTWFGCGKSPIAPGTVGALAALPLHVLLRGLNPVAYWSITLGITAVGVWSANRTAADLATDDPQCVVIDEVAGAMIAMGLVRGDGLRRQVLALVLFRAFDILKPGIIDRAQRAKPEGVGIMADDVLAGFAAGFSARWLPRLVR